METQHFTNAGRQAQKNEEYTLHSNTIPQSDSRQLVTK